MKNIAIVILSLLSLLCGRITAAEKGIRCRVPLTVTTPLKLSNVPMDPVIDFRELIKKAGLAGTLDPNSIEVIDLTSGQQIAHVVNEDFSYGDKGRIEWVIANPAHTKYEIRFHVVSKRPPLKPPAYTPQIGTGDLLRYNSGPKRPITSFYAANLVDLNNDGRSEFAGCWNYAYRPGDPWDGIICYPRETGQGFSFGNLTRLRHVEDEDDTTPEHFKHIYMGADFADFNKDGKTDLVYTRRGTSSASIYLNTGKTQADGMPLFKPGGDVAVSGWEASRAVDLNSDDSMDLVINGTYVRNKNPKGWPFEGNAPVALDAGRQPCFLDLDGDGRPDSICLQGGKTTQPDGYRIVWRKNLGSDPPKFSEEQALDGIDLEWCSYVSAIDNGNETGLLIQHDVFQTYSFYELKPGKSAQPRFELQGRMESQSSVLSLSDQAWPSVSDWDDDGDLDLLVGSGYGWPRIVINSGSNARPAYAEAKRIVADGKPIRLIRNEILGKPDHWHDMGYVYPVFIDWDGDGVKDLVCPNETNRIFWYRNIGSRKDPIFGKRQQLLVEGYPDSTEAKQRSAELAIKATYPQEKERPFFWRTAAAFADWNGDGLTDLITHDGETRQAALFTQYRDASGTLRLRKDHPMTLKDGRPIDDRIVGRNSHWTEGFRPYDWDDDGLIDLIYSCAGAQGGIQDSGSIYFLRNCGTKTKPLFENPETLRCFGEPIRITNHGPNAWPCDYDGDGKPDLVACVEWSVYPFYRHAALVMKSRPEYKLGPLTVEKK